MRKIQLRRDGVDGSSELFEAGALGVAGSLALGAMAGHMIDDHGGHIRLVHEGRSGVTEGVEIHFWPINTNVPPIAGEPFGKGMSEFIICATGLE